MAWLALGLSIAGLGYAFGLRSYLAWRATGDTGLRTRVGPVGSVAWWAKLLFLAAIVLLLAGPATTLAGWPAMTWQTGAAVQAVGVVIAVAGMLIVAAAQHGMGSSWRIGVDTSETTGLVTGGLFALARNPIFTGMIVFAAGIALMAPGSVSAAALGMLLIAMQMQVRAVEEPYLLHTHGDAYRRYAVHTGRFPPNVSRSSRGVASQNGKPLLVLLVVNLAAGEAFSQDPLRAVRGPRGGRVECAAEQERAKDDDGENEQGAAGHHEPSPAAHHGTVWAVHR